MTNLEKALKYLKFLSDEYEFGPDRQETLDTLEGAKRELEEMQFLLQRYGGDGE